MTALQLPLGSGFDGLTSTLFEFKIVPRAFSWSRYQFFYPYTSELNLLFYNLFDRVLKPKVILFLLTDLA